jgi:hypothetical protein
VDENILGGLVSGSATRTAIGGRECRGEKWGGARGVKGGKSARQMIDVAQSEEEQAFDHEVGGSIPGDGSCFGRCFLVIKMVFLGRRCKYFGRFK